MKRCSQCRARLESIDINPRLPKDSKECWVCRGIRLRACRELSAMEVVAEMENAA